MPGLEKLLMEESQPLLQPPVIPRDGFPAPADFAFALHANANNGVYYDDSNGEASAAAKSTRQLPQAIAHRGYKAKFPENTMAAFSGAIDVGAHAIETDVHLSKDGVVVLSHDPSLERCFGRKEKIIDCDWEFLSTLRTKAKAGQPSEPMPRLSDLLEFMTKPGNENLWVLLDIKRDNNLDDVMRLIAETIASVPASSSRPWTQRVVLGVWSPKYLPFISKYMPEFPMTYISFSLPCAWYFLEHVPRISFNMYAPALVGPIGAAFRKKANRLHRPVFAWTVNKERMMEWSIAKGLDGVVTDEPLKFLEVCKRWKENSAAKRLDEVERWTWNGWKIWEMLDLLRVHLFILLLTPVIVWWLRPWGAVREVGRHNKVIQG
ncbi:Glycerophosphoryl diester phosphodiesterase [Botryosphaeria dothidea]|uniref:Glycerophosphoryl diester phosphodiesterase n=1 Tax=Botryosphaeria dothidea TaxID=55169 RepID=A0A8H4N2B0_9PEZI|nr:Glycerophosphoryl diester phosphodiesterase [Botryosphaeria dothidea]